MILYVHNSVRLGRKPKRHQPVGEHFRDQNLFAYFFKFELYIQYSKRTAKIIQNEKKKNYFIV